MTKSKLQIEYFIKEIEDKIESEDKDAKSLTSDNAESISNRSKKISPSVVMEINVVDLFLFLLNIIFAILITQCGSQQSGSKEAENTLKELQKRKHDIDDLEKAIVRKDKKMLKLNSEYEFLKQFISDTEIKLSTNELRLKLSGVIRERKGFIDAYQERLISRIVAAYQKLQSHVD